MTKHNILFLVTGMTPQIITETLWALACDPAKQEKWVPNEIQVLSTTTGLKKIKDNLLGDNGIFKKMCEEYNLPEIKFDENSLNAIIDKEGNKLDDLKTPEENELAADMICQKVREFTQDDNVSLHVSIAGGRKTMGFYAGYALSLYGRLQDQLSHVLVSEKYETLQGFYYPALKKGQNIIKKTHKKMEQGHDVYEEELLDAFDAKVWLANIPFVRLREFINPKNTIVNKSFSTVIEMVNASLRPFSVTLDVNDRKVIIGDKECKLSPKEFSLYLLVAELKREGKTLYYPAQNKRPNQEEIESMEEQQSLFNEIYSKYKNEKKKEKIDEQYLCSGLAKLRKEFTEKFGESICEQIDIASVDGKNGGRRSINLDNHRIIIRQ
ncbi:MAG: CRISPR-associated ring nuclease Csm6 [Moraxella sp.]